MPIDDALAQLGPSIKYPKIEPTSTSGSYIFLPENEYHKDLLVSKERKYFGEIQQEAHKELNIDDSYMLTIRQFVDFLKLLKSGNVYDENRNKISDKEIELILDDILAQKNPYRAEWLDARFETIREHLCLIDHFFYEGIKSESTEILEDCLMQDKTPGIDLNYWLNNANFQGLPPKNTPDGKLYYHFPKKGTVARFGACSVGVVLVCCGVPLVSNPGLRVRPVKILKP